MRPVAVSEGVLMPAAHPPEFRQRTVDLARLREQPVAKIAKDLGISESCLRNWMAQADINDGHRRGLTATRRRNRWRCVARTGCSSWRGIVKTCGSGFSVDH